MSQQYGGPTGPQGQPPQYGQQPPQYGQPQQPPQPQPGVYQQPQPQPGAYQPQPGVYQQPQPQPGVYQQPQPGYGQPGGPNPLNQAAQVLQAAAPQVEADAYERTLSLLVYVWLAFFGLTQFITVAGISIPGLGSSAILTGGGFSFHIDLAGLLGLVFPFVVLNGVRGGQLAKFHAKQALFLAGAYLVVAFVLGLFLLIQVEFIQDILVNGILIGLAKLIFIAAALLAGVRAFANRELWRIPVIGTFVK